VGKIDGVTGFVNGLAVAKSGRFMVAAIGQEHRLGRWSKIKEARNGAQLVQLPTKSSN
jgi:ribosomal RNA-processing protein 9